MRCIQTDPPEADQRPLEFNQCIRSGVAAKFATSERLLEVSKEDFHTPASTIQVGDLFLAQPAFVGHTRDEVNRMTRTLHDNQSKDQWRLFASGCFVSPDVNNAVGLTHVTQFLQSLHIRTNTHQELSSTFQNSVRKIVTDETSIARE